VGMVLAIRCHRQNMKTSIINGSEVSRFSVAIHSSRLTQSFHFFMFEPIFSPVNALNQPI
ncbi:hypothetical protein, partial [Citrobacter sp. Cpo107]|uniref:hypothetical protein n=1 Tax=Citrobacter sp. Cpo107 TaxID=2985144 RepID=UPI0025758D93